MRKNINPQMTQMYTHKRDPETYAIIGTAMAVHNELGNGFLEGVYQEALERELQARKIPHDRERDLHIFFTEVRDSTPSTKRILSASEW